MPDPTPAVSPSVADPLTSGGRIVVGVDDSEHAAAALRWALREAVVRRVKLEVVHVWQVPMAALPFGATITLTKDDADIDAAAREQLDALVNAVIEETADSDPPVALPEVLRTVVPGTPAMTLVELASDAALLVVGSHGRTGLRHFVIGSVAHACVQRALCPVVVVPLPA